MKITPFIAVILMVMTLSACGGDSDSGPESGGDTGTADGGTDGNADGGTDGNADGGTDGNADGGTDGTADGGTDGNADGGTDGNADGGTDGNADGGTDGNADGGTDGNADGGTDGNADGGTGGNADGGTDGNADGGTDGNADGGTDGNADGGTDGNADGGTDGNADGGNDGNTDGGETINGGTPVVTPESALFARGSLGANDSVPAVSCDPSFTYSNANDLESALENTLTAGTTLCLADGTYNGIELTITGAGTADLPVTVTAENPGMAIINGEVSVNMSGEYVVLQGFVFRDGTSNGDVIQTRTSGVHCNNCRITENAIIDVGVGSTDSARWVKIYGENNRIDHNWFSGKTTAAVLMEVVRENDEANRALNTTIDHNYFGDRPPIDGKAYAESSDNEYEAIRVGFSGTHQLDAFTTIEYNYFERIDAEAEVISNKAGSSTILYNTIRDSYGSLTTRHGANAVIEGNYIIGDDHPFAGGLRIIDDGHTVVNNYVHGSRYYDTPWHGGIVLHKGDSSTTNGYQNVENVLVAHNTVVDSVNSLNVAGGNRSVNPTDVYLVNNIIANGIGAVITRAEDGLPSGNTAIAGNTFFGQAFSDNQDLTSAPGIDFTPAELAQDEFGIWRPIDGNSLLAATDANIGDFSLPQLDMDGHTRSGGTQQGADHLSDSAKTIGFLSHHDVGPINYRPAPGAQHVERIALTNSDFDNGSAEGWTLSDAHVTTNFSETFSRASSIKIVEASGLISQDVSVEPNTQYTFSAFSKGSATLGAMVSGVNSISDSESEDYRFNSVTFNSGTASSVTLFAQPDQTIDVEAVIDGSFTDFRANGGDTENWTTIEGDSIGDIGSSGDSASSGEGSARLRYRTPEHANGSPTLIQNVIDVLPNTDYVFSAYVKRNSEAQVLLQLDIENSGTTVVDAVTIDYGQLDESTEAEDGFLRFDYSFNSGDSTALELSISFVPQAIDTGGQSIETDSNGNFSGDTGRLNEIRVDDVSLSYEGNADGETQVFLDSFRLVKHGN